ncbi:hypothetical protein Goklo_012781, partial [Gossypium klotzschianum]|nr:hypothetical protein [Gossypium klotzschianum]
VDPKSILCEFFKVGKCAKGFKCKFSHDLNVQRKGEKIDIYSDKIDQETMEDCDQETLEKVVESKAKEYQQNKPTDIVSFFSVALVEIPIMVDGQSKAIVRFVNISWKLWKRNNMVGFGSAQMLVKVLLEEESEKTPIEEEIENQRAKLKTSTPMTPELFMEWKKKKIAERDESLAAQRAERAKNERMSGRELFMSDASVFVDDAKAYEKYQREEEYDVPENKANNNSATDGPSASATSAADAESLTDDDDE